MSINLIERARKSAGMQSLSRDVPVKEERGALWWGKFISALRAHQESLQDEYFAAVRESEKKSARISQLEGELNEVRKLKAGHAIRNVCSTMASITDADERRLLEAVN